MTLVRQTPVIQRQCHVRLARQINMQNRLVQRVRAVACYVVHTQTTTDNRNPALVIRIVLPAFRRSRLTSTKVLTIRYRLRQGRAQDRLRGWTLLVVEADLDCISLKARVWWADGLQPSKKSGYICVQQKSGLKTLKHGRPPALAALSRLSRTPGTS